MFFYIATISKNKGYENLAASIGSTNETFNQSYSSDFDSSEAPTFLGCLSFLCLLRSGGLNHTRGFTSPAGRLKSHQRGFWIETLFQMQKTKALNRLFPENVRRVEKQADSYFSGVDAQEIPGGKPEV